MTSAIEQTRREMYYDLKRVGSMVSTTHLFKTFEESLDAHLEELRKGMVACNESTVKCARASAESFRALEESNIELSARCIALTEERDTLRNKLQALQMASSTAAEVIRGLRSELEEAREGAIPKSVAMHSIQIDCAQGVHLLSRHESTGSSTCICCGTRK